MEVALLGRLLAHQHALQQEAAHVRAHEMMGCVEPQLQVLAEATAGLALGMAQG